MSLNIKLFFLVLLSSITICNAQDTSVENDDFNDDPETVFFNFEIFRPVGMGDSFLARDYNTGAGFAFDFNWFFVPNFTVGTHFNIFRGSVENQSAVGNIQSTTVAMFGLTAGYYYEVDQHWNVHATTGFGTLNYRNTAPEDKFSEQGTSYWVQVQVAYRFNKTVAVYFKMEPRLDKLKIVAPPGLDQYFNRHFMLNPGFGLRINFHNPGG